MNFSCNGEIVWLKIAGQLRSNMQYSQYPKLRIWRRPRWSIILEITGHYEWTGSEVVLNSSMCSMGTWTDVTDSSNVYQCSLEENAYVSFQHGDIISLILPPLKDAKFLLYFTTQSGPTNYIYYQDKRKQWLQFDTENAQPQIILGVRSSKFFQCTCVCVCVCVCVCSYVHVYMLLQGLA